MKNIKKIIAIVMVILAVATTFSGCSSEKPEPKENVSKTSVQKEITPADEEKTEPEVEINDDNVFFNDTNNAYEYNNISIKPRYVYWDGDNLVAECFVINGYSHNIYDIDVKSLSFSNESGEIASASFGTINGATIAPLSNIVWTFTFSKDCVSMSGADLSSLLCQYNISNKY